MRIKMTVCMIVILLQTLFSCVEKEGIKEIEFKPYVITNQIYDVPIEMKNFIFKSSYTKETMRIDVSYIKGNEQKKNMPVIYITDGYWRRIDHKYIHYLTNQGIIPAVFVVCVGYTNDYDAGKIWKTRGKDLYDNPGPYVQAFKHEIIPAVEKRYSCDPLKRILYGVSLGGHFSVYTLLDNINKNDALFYGYIAGSPYYIYDRLTGLVDSLSQDSKSYGAKFFIGYGENDFGGRDSDENYQPDIEKFVKKVTDSGFANLQFVHYRYPGKNHYTVTRASMLDGVRYMFSNSKDFSPWNLQDLDFGSLQYDFHTSTGVYDWEPVGAITAVDYNNKKELGLGSETGSMMVQVDFRGRASGELGAVFEKGSDLTDHETKFNVYVPKDLARLKYTLQLFIHSTTRWQTDYSQENYVLSKTGWNNISNKWTKQSIRSGDLTQVRRVGFILTQRAGSRPWKGTLYLDDISFK